MEPKSTRTATAKKVARNPFDESFHFAKKNEPAHLAPEVVCRKMASFLLARCEIETPSKAHRGGLVNRLAPRLASPTLYAREIVKER